MNNAQTSFKSFTSMLRAAALRMQDAGNELEEFQESFEQQDLRKRMQRADTRADRRAHHLAKKNAAPTIGDLIAPGVPNDVRLVFGDKRLVS